MKNKEKIPKGDYLVVNNLQNTANTPGFMDALMAFQYGETAEESNAGFEQMKRIMSGEQLEETTNNLFEQIKDIEIIGARLSGEPEVIHEIEDYFRQTEYYPIVRNQIKRILQYVPPIFPENWKSPEGFDELSEREKKAYIDIAKQGLQQIPGPVIQKVIELAIGYREEYKK